ncbi:MAG: hypothetical protein ACC645_18480 [Pirellulales bacterium]
MRQILIGVMSLATCLVLCQKSLADGVILNGVSAQTIGRGGTNIAHTDN